jgi:hypothetical protein
MQRSDPVHRQSLIAFGIYLRTGRRIDPGTVEVKFNPWHDEQDGRFTFAGQGRYFPADSSGNGRPHGGFQGGGTSGGGGATGDIPIPRNTRRTVRAREDGVPDRSHLRPDHPNNYSIYIVQPGDSLSRIAERRKGLTVRGLAWLNQHPIDKPLGVGQRIKVPNQSYLDAGRDAKNKFMALAYYRQTHGGKSPPNPANPPSLESQILDTNWRRETKNGYDFHIDVLSRPREISGELPLGPTAPRSRRSQAEAGKPDRRASDDGGHFIAVRFNGPSDSFNHFAQDANFNRGAYRALEDQWAKDLGAKHKVFVDIEPRYVGTSRRPYHLTVTWYVDGEKFVSEFPNQAKGEASGAR